MPEQTRLPLLVSPRDERLWTLQRGHERRTCMLHAEADGVQLQLFSTVAPRVLVRAHATRDGAFESANSERRELLGSGWQALGAVVDS